MTLHFRTAHASYFGTDRVDITRSGCDALLRQRRDAPGACFAPSADLVYPCIRHVIPGAHALIAASEQDGVDRGGMDLIRAVWRAYKQWYIAEQRVSYGVQATLYGPLEKLAVKRGVRPRHDRWAWWLVQERATFVCLCKRVIGLADGSRELMCHRAIMPDVLVPLGAVYEGEVKGGG